MKISSQKILEVAWSLRIWGWHREVHKSMRIIDITAHLRGKNEQDSNISERKKLKSKCRTVYLCQRNSASPTRSPLASLSRAPETLYHIKGIYNLYYHHWCTSWNFLEAQLKRVKSCLMDTDATKSTWGSSIGFNRNFAEKWRASSK